MPNGNRFQFQPIHPLKPGKPPRWSLTVDAAFEGGGAKGFCYLGALDVFSRAGVWFDRVCGCSAGSITGALIAAGYEVDPKYRLDTGLMPLFDGLRPSPNNSLNQIIMDDNFDRMYDLPEAISDDEIRRSWTKRLFDRLFPHHAVLGRLVRLRNQVAGLPIGFRNPAEKTQARNNIRSWLKDKRNVPPFGIEHNLAEKIANVIVDTTDWIVTPVGRFVRDSALALLQFIPTDLGMAVLAGVYQNGRSDPADVRAVKTVFREGFAVLERGGILAGDFFRNWLEAHLQARLGVPGGVTGRSAGGFVAFRDLPMDLCVAAFCLDCNEMLYFSRKTTPDYSVSEAVRRSMSLPVVFIPRRLDEGHPGEISGSLRKHAGHIVMDGGFRVDLPGWVFRDPGQKYMDLLPKKRLVCFKLNELKSMPSRSDAGIPVAEQIEVLRPDSLLDRLGIHTTAGLSPEHCLPPGIRLILRQLPVTGEALTSREEEIKVNIGVWENTGMVDIGVKEMGLGDPRPWLFNLSKRGKKWMGKSGWDAAVTFLQALPADVRQTLKIPHSDDPYGASR